MGAHLIGIDNEGGRCSWLPGLFCDYGIPITSSLPGRRCNIHACLGCETVTAVGRQSHLSFACSAGLSSKMELVFRSGVPCFFHQNFSPWGFFVCLFWISVFEPEMLLCTAGISPTVGCHYFSSNQAYGKDFVASSVTVDLWLLVSMRH